MKYKESLRSYILPTVSMNNYFKILYECEVMKQNSYNIEVHMLGNYFEGNEIGIKLFSINFVVKNLKNSKAADVYGIITAERAS